MVTDICILGAQKCATSSLFEQLSASPEIVGAKPKEPQFFANAKNWRAELDGYHALYPKRDGLRLEASTTYTFAPHRNPAIWEDMHVYNPAMKLIYIVRDPVARIRSHYGHSFRRGYTKLPLDEYVRADPLPIAVSRYYSQILPFIRAFGDGQVLILRFEDVTSGKATGDVADFVGIDRASIGPVPHANAADTVVRTHRGMCLADRIKRKLRPSLKVPDTTMPPRLAAAIRETLEPEMAGIERLTGFNLSA